MPHPRLPRRLWPRLAAVGVDDGLFMLWACWRLSSRRSWARVPRLVWLLWTVRRLDDQICVGRFGRAAALAAGLAVRTASACWPLDARAVTAATLLAGDPRGPGRRRDLRRAAHLAHDACASSVAGGYWAAACVRAACWAAAAAKGPEAAQHARDAFDLAGACLVPERALRAALREAIPWGTVDAALTRKEAERATRA